MSFRVLIVVSALAALVAVIFGLWPGLDLAIARSFTVPGQGFISSAIPAFVGFRNISMWPPNAIWVIAWLGLLAKFIFPRRKMLVSGVAAVFLIATTFAAPFLLMNGVLKQYSGRPRPAQTMEFGGDLAFKPWWDLSGACPRNCSLASGEASTAFWLVAPAALVPLPLRAAAFTAAIAYGSAVAILRMAFGGHFFTDVFFAAYLTYLVIWLAYALLYRWPRTQASGEAIEAGIARAGLAVRRVFGRPAASVAMAPAPAPLVQGGETVQAATSNAGEGTPAP